MDSDTKIHPKLFNTNMVRAILSNKKTETRRLITESNSDCIYPLSELNWNIWFPNYIVSARGLKVKYDEDDTMQKVWHKHNVCDKIWVRETWNHTSIAIGLSNDDENSGYIYKASDNGEDWEKNSEKWTWQPSIFMPYDAARLWLEYIDIHGERLQDITEIGAINEGVLTLPDAFLRKHFKEYMQAHDEWVKSGTKNNRPPIGPSPVERYKALWNSINGVPKPVLKKKKIVGYEMYPWEQGEYTDTYRNFPLKVKGNPMVWVEQFKVLSTTGKPDNI